MVPDPGNPDEAEGVLNPASGRGPDGQLYLLPRLVASGNVSRVGLATVDLVDGVPTGVSRRGVVLAPETGWEQSPSHSGVEDPRVTFVPMLGRFLMTYVAYGPLGPRPALATSVDLLSWKRLGPLHFEYQEDLDVDLNLIPNKDVVFFPEPVPGPDGELCFAALHRPMWDLDWIVPGAGSPLPTGVTDDRPGIWISYIPVAAAIQNVSAMTHLGRHRLVAMPEYDFEALKIGAGPPPLRVPEGWLLIHHGVAGALVPGVDQQQAVHYAAGAMILSAGDPSVVLARTAKPLLEPALGAEINGIVPNVVFPTAIEQINDRTFVFYGMADSQIGVATLDRSEETSP
ncbi:glycosidase [Nakamurella sp. UYEF19]|uniref:glycoside hydrolase family 130 protein n=1 Tax=Nakamurella sp. UYEF19 TaxID=1756392 RepID=UPI0033940872